MVFGMIVAPGLAKLTPQSRAEFVLNVFPRYVRYTVVFAIITLAFGVGSLIVFTNGNFSMLALTSSFGMYIPAGALLALIAFAIGISVAIPAANKVVRITKSIAGNAGPPPPELLAASKRMRVGTTATMVILVLVTILMVAGATL